MTSDTWLISNAKSFYGIIDVRSPEEFQAGSMPGARNLTLALNEGEAETVRSVSRSNLLKGSLLATEFLTRKAYQQIATLRQEFPEGSQILIYGDSVDDERVSMWVDALAKFGVKVSILESGFDGYESWVSKTLACLIPKMKWNVVSGSVASGKTDLIRALASEGEQTIDTDSMIRTFNQTQSILNLHSDLAWQLLAMNKNRQIWAEFTGSERMEQVLPTALKAALKSPSQLFMLSAPLSERVRSWSCNHITYLNNRQSLVDAIVAKNDELSAETVSGWHGLAVSPDAEDCNSLIAGVIASHYDVRHRRTVADLHAGAGEVVKMAMSKLDAVCFRRAARAMAAIV